MARFDATALKADNPLSEYLPKRGIEVRPNGREWVCRCPLPGHGDSTPSFTIRQGRNGQQFHCFGCEGSGDVIGFVMQLDGVTFDQACEILGGERAPPDNHRQPVAPAAPAVDVYAAWTPAAPPKGTKGLRVGERTPPLENPKRGTVTHYTPTAVYRYNDAAGRFLAYVLRADFGDRKMTPLIQWCENGDRSAWCHRPFVGPRPLYRLHQLVTRSDAQVLVVEGEKCADAAQALLPSLAVTTWQGGGKAAGKSDWSPVSGRDVLIWPDADPEGLTAAHEAGRLATEAGARSVRLIEIPEDKPKGWDIADAIEAGWTKADVVRFARAGARPWGEPQETPRTAPEPPAADSQRFDGPADEQGGERERLTRPALRPARQEKPQPEPESKPDNVYPLHDKIKKPTPDDAWKSACYFKPGTEEPIPKLMSNVIAFLGYAPEMRGVFAFDVFANKIVLTRRPPWEPRDDNWKSRPYRDADAVSAVSYLDRWSLNTNKASCEQAVRVIAERNKIDPIRTYLESLVWDQIPRVHTGVDGKSMLERYFGVRSTPGMIERAFGMRWAISIVARNLTDNPDGEKADAMLIFEGAQGLLKSTSLSTFATLMGNRYYTSGISDFESMNTILKLQGKLVGELDEMTAILKYTDGVTKSYLSQQTDEPRLVYDKMPTKIRRRYAFAGTINPQQSGYLRDPTGGRRFWPVFVERPADLVALERDREQLWAELVHLYREGEQWWLTPQEEEIAQTNQESRFEQDAWGDKINQVLSGRLEMATPAERFVSIDQLLDSLGVTIKDRNRISTSRVVAHLTQMKWVRRRKIVDGRKIYVFVPGEHADDE